MGEYTGLIMFLWIVVAPTIGFVVLSMWTPRRLGVESNYAPVPVRREHATVRTARDPNQPI
jgi:hypothetical protein